MFFARKRSDPPAMTLEGVLGPNSRLDEAAGMQVSAPGALAVTAQGQLLFSSGSAVQRLRAWGGKAERWAEFPARVTALACSPGGRVAVGLEGGGLVVADEAGRLLDGWTAPADLLSATDCLFLSEDEVAVVDNGYGAGEPFLALAPWDDAARGKVVAIARAGAPRVVAGGLHCPMGVAQTRAGELAISQLERANIVAPGGALLQSGFPGYPGRLRRTETGYVLACLSRRDPLVEFLKTERDFVAEMKARIEPRHWIGPRANPEFSHDFPIELGAARLFGEVKPWAPSFSYGLVIELSDHFVPVASAHSRANGARHAISDVCVWNGALLAVSSASGEILNLGVGSLAA